MNHFASNKFWTTFEKLPSSVQKLAKKNFELLKKDLHHPSLRLKRVGRFWSARVGLKYRALAIDCEDGLIWFWIGNHQQYEDLIK